jgi:hypothetical protein
MSLAKFGDFIPAEDGSQRHKCAHLFGTFIATVDYNHYHILFVNNEVKECYSNCISIEAATASFSPDLPPLPQIRIQQKNEEPDPDQPEEGKDENLEHLPSQDAGDEEEEAKETIEQAEGEEAKVEQAEGGQAESEQRLSIGQLPHVTKANPPNYHERKLQAFRAFWLNR